MTLTTTFALLREHNACKEGYGKLAKHLGGVTKYGRDMPIPLAVILESNGLDDTIWSLSAVPLEQTAERDRIARLFACDCAESVLHIYEAAYPGDDRPRTAITTARQYAVGDAVNDQLAAAGAAAWAAVMAAAWAAAGSAAGAAVMAAQTALLKAYLEVRA
jgi:hypothetical protein